MDFGYWVFELWTIYWYAKKKKDNHGGVEVD